MIDPQELFNQIVQLQSVTPNLKENGRAMSIIASLRRQLAVIEEPFAYSITFTAAGSVNGVIQIQADADFKIMAGAFFSGDADVTADTWVIPDLTVLLTDTGNGRQLSDQPLQVSNWFGDAKLPFVWPVPKLLTARSTLQVQISEAQDLQLVFHGVKLYPLPG
ncbi:MAG: hypothetical protein ACREUQ_04055 [Burkholderiales bacterium]